MVRMIGKRAKVLSARNVEDLLVFAAQTRHPVRNEVMVLLSVKAGLRAGEISNLTWPMLVEPTGEIGTVLELQDRAAKKRSGRVIPVHPDLHAALANLARLTLVLDGPVIQSERGGPMTPVSIVCWFRNAFRAVGLEGCSSHSLWRCLQSSCRLDLPTQRGRSMCTKPSMCTGIK